MSREVAAPLWRGWGKVFLRRGAAGLRKSAALPPASEGNAISGKGGREAVRRLPPDDLGADNLLGEAKPAFVVFVELVAVPEGAGAAGGFAARQRLNPACEAVGGYSSGRILT